MTEDERFQAQAVEIVDLMMNQRPDESLHRLRLCFEAEPDTASRLRLMALVEAETVRRLELGHGQADGSGHAECQ